MATKIKVKQLKKAVGGVDINGMFEEMMGMKDADADIIVPKFVLVRNKLRHVYRVLHQFNKVMFADYPEHAQSIAEIQSFIDKMKVETCIASENEAILDTEESEIVYKNVSKDTINELYRKLKENVYVKHMVTMCSKLKQYYSNFSNLESLKENFVKQEPGFTLFIFEFSSLDLKALWNDANIKPFKKKYILTVLNKLYITTHTIYKCITSPDVDVTKFTETLIKAISDLKKQPALHRCHNAFKRIEQSVGLLKEKFDDYYRESVASENADMLVMNFIMDVSNQGGANATLAREFRTIIKYMHDVSQKTGKNKDPNVKKIFKMLNNNFAMMEKNMSKDKATKNDDDTADTADTTNSTIDSTIDSNGESVEAKERREKRLEKQRAKRRRKRVAKKNSKAEANEQDEQLNDNEQYEQLNDNDANDNDANVNEQDEQLNDNDANDNEQDEQLNDNDANDNEQLNDNDANDNEQDDNEQDDQDEQDEQDDELEFSSDNQEEINSKAELDDDNQNELQNIDMGKLLSNMLSKMGVANIEDITNGDDGLPEENTCCDFDNNAEDVEETNNIDDIVDKLTNNK